MNAGVSEDICLSKIMPGFGKALKSESASGVPHPFSDGKNNGKINGKGGKGRSSVKKTVKKGDIVH